MMTYRPVTLLAFALFGWVLAGEALAQLNPVAPENARLRAYQRLCLQYEPTKYPTGGYEWRGYSTGGYEWRGYSTGGYEWRGYSTGGYDSRLGSCRRRAYIGNPFVEKPPAVGRLPDRPYTGIRDRESPRSRPR